MRPAPLHATEEGQPLASKPPIGPAVSVFRDEIAKRKSSSKSRNGCVTCKARRVKCDETKPTCDQCARRRITCGGYKKDIRFRPVERPMTSAQRTQPNKNQEPQDQPQESEDSAWLELGLLNHDESVDSGTDLLSSLSSWPLPDLEGFDFSYLDPGSESPWNQAPIAQLSNLRTTFDADPVRDHTPPLEERQDADAGSDQNATPGLDLSAFASFPTLPISPGKEHNASLARVLGLEEETPEDVAVRFHQHTCQVMTIDEEPSKNPWATLIWPMARDSTALYHALAAMTYLQLSKIQPSLRSIGLEHIQRSTQALRTDLGNGSIQVDAALAATIALGFAETWDYQKSSTGRDHIRGARILLQQALSNHVISEPGNDNFARLKFLANTWIYMDVIARLTSDCGSPPNTEFLSIFSIGSPLSGETDPDPLMGYATTLFPTIGRVADLVSEIRTRSSKRNSPSIISRAIELRKAIVEWSPAVDLEEMDNPTWHMTDAIQTAEAYRWATLLLLAQAAPELPSLRSLGELGQKTLVYLATIPDSSQTTIVHTFPLMVAASEAVEEEDRQFVRERWQSMSKRMVTGIVDRCIEITEEVWRRRDAYLAERMASTSPGNSANRLSPKEFGGTNNFNGSDTVAGFDSTLSAPNRTPPPVSTSPRTSMSINEFPISTAFRKGVDTLTRSGNIEYTVRGRLHWLGVMKEWGWEVMLG